MVDGLLATLCVTIIVFKGLRGDSVAIILCSECKSKISSKANTCPNCGCPVIINKSMKICKINGIEYDFTNFYNRIIIAKQNNGLWSDKDVILVTQEIRKLTGLAKTFQLCQIIAETEAVPNEYNGESMEELNAKQRAIQTSKPKCPTCGSTNIQKISATSKAFGAIGFGILSKTAKSQFKCNSCGYKW